MSIQFLCAQCGQPIEVDDQHAGQTAACPYCHHTVTVPTESTYAPEAGVVARPMDGAEPPAQSGPPGLPPQPGPPALPPQLGQWQSVEAPQRPQAPNTLGTYAVICTALALALLGVQIVASLALIGPLLTPATSQPALPSAADQMEAMEDVMAQHPWLSALSFGTLFFGLAGLVLGAVSLYQKPRGNWRGLLSIILCGLLFLCQCAGFAMGFAAGAAG